MSTNALRQRCGDCFLFVLRDRTMYGVVSFLVFPPLRCGMNRSEKVIPSGSSTPASRRKFLQGGGMMLAGGALVGSNLSVARGAHAFGSDTIKVGLIGCGSRGTGAAIQSLGTATSSHSGIGGDVKLVAMADVFQSNLHAAYRSIKGEYPEKVDAHDRRFVGLDAYQQVLKCDIDLVILATPPGFRPQHFEAAVNADKHVFMEKPLATDSAGVRRILSSQRDRFAERTCSPGRFAATT